MDFFENQDRAKRKTHILIAYYVLAVALIIVVVYAAFMLVFMGAAMRGAKSAAIPRFWNPQTFGWVASITSLVVLFGTFYKVAQLSRGGEAVAELLGGRPIDPGAADPDERKILNVVEEMSVASGVPAPRVFILDAEAGINAFAAGFTHRDAVIGVTRGAVARLTRDELQGVIGHEFSHIFHGDMRLNVRLMGALHGILVIALVGYWSLLAAGRGSSRSRSRSRGGGTQAGIAIFGLILMAIGYIGVFFGNLIKAAVSRQREFLADAASVQFTRNPTGLAGALRAIAEYAGGSRIENPRAQEASHLFFGDAMKRAFFGLLATHPPIEERIRRIAPSVLADTVRRPARAAPPPVPAEVSGFVSASARLPARPEQVLSTVGDPCHEHLAHAAGLLDAVPESLAAAAREPFGARAVIYALLTGADAAVRASQEQALSERADPATRREVAMRLPAVRAIGPELRVPLVDMALTGLRGLSPNQYAAFRDTMETLINADRQIDLFEHMLRWRIFRHLEPVFRKLAQPVIRHYSLQPILPKCRALLACLAHWGAADPAAAQTAYEQGCARLQAEPPGPLQPAAQCGLPVMDDALHALETASPAIKRHILEAAIACVATDGRVAIEEAELLRVVADCLGLPLPPFLPSHQAAATARDG
ncbi:MAG: M48 family metallopeptidase [Verrucomicrobiota bacterium]|nr:M48 family metallopeptidase [Verrucomicrobiota bacterium]